VELTEAFAVQDAIAERVAGAIEPELLKTESLPPAVLHTGNATAWDLVRQGTWHFHHVGRDSHLKARDLFRQACTLDGELAEAHVWLARVSAGLAAYGWSDKLDEDIREGLGAALKAIQLDEKNPYSHYALAITSVFANAPEQLFSPRKRLARSIPALPLGTSSLAWRSCFAAARSRRSRRLNEASRSMPTIRKTSFGIMSWRSPISSRTNPSWDSPPPSRGGK
jgi:hypothetical protein